MVKLVNRAKMTTSTTGTGPITLGAASNGYQSFADAGVSNSDTIRYVIEDGTNWEIGTGVYTSSNTSLTRNVSESSNSDAPIVLSGYATIFVSATASDFVVTGSDVTMSGGGTSQDYAGFSTRAAFVTWASGKSPAVGVTINAAGYSYRYTGSGTAISDLPGWVPNGDVTAKHWAAAGDGITDDTAALNAALSFSNDVFLPIGTYTVTSLSNFAFGKRFTGPGIIRATAEFQTPYFGGTITAGSKIGNTVPVAQHGGFLVGGAGPTKNGVFLKTQNEGILDIIPSRDGVPLELQLYSNALQGYGDFTGTTLNAISRNGSFSAASYPNDIVWIGPIEYRIDSITGAGTIVIKNLDGSAASSPADTSQTFWTMYHHAEHVMNLSGGVLTWVSGDDIQSWGGDHNVVINGARYEVLAIDSTAKTYTVVSPPANATNITVLHRWITTEDYISIFRLQTLRSGGKEMTLSMFVRPDFAGMRIGDSGSGNDAYSYIQPFAFLTGRSADREQISGEDNMTGEGYTALYIGGQGTNVGKVGIGNRNPLTPLDVKWSFKEAAGADNTTKEIAAFRSAWRGSDENRVGVIKKNNGRPGGFQAYDSGTIPQTLSLQPVGGSMIVGSWDEVSASAIMQVDSTTKGVLGPRMTTTQRNAISSPDAGLEVYDTTLSRKHIAIGGAWYTQPVVGDYGIGVAITPSQGNVADLNSINKAGFYSFDGTAGSTNTPTGSYGSLININRYSTAEAAQLAFAATADKMYLRRRGSGAPGSWQSWREVYHQASVLGTVSQSSGIPTGALIERGSNANGEYVRFSDGTQICVRSNLSAANASTALGSIFRSADMAWTFPAAFASTTGLTVTGCADDADSWVAGNTLTTTTVNLRILAGATKVSAINVRGLAIGRWF